MSRPDSAISKSKLLVGEGIEEVYFFDALLRHMGIQDIQIDQYGGKSRLPERLKALVMRTGFRENVRSLGIVRDADYGSDQCLSETAAFQSVCSALDGAGLSIPPSVGAQSVGLPVVSVLIVPGNGRPGMLEDICLDSVRSRPEFVCVEGYLDCIRAKSRRVQQQHNMAKSQVHIWLASMAEPDKQLGQAAAAGYWNLDDAAFDSVRAFVRAL